MEDVDGWTTLETRSSAFLSRLQERIRAFIPDLAVERHASIFWLVRAAAAPLRQPQQIPASHVDWFRRFFHAALARGVYLPPSAYEVCFLSLAHDDDVLAEAADALEAAAKDSV
jgi:glutamate-1-semialdehyde 2,1-aminomutase